MKRPELPENLGALLDKLTALGERVIGKGLFMELRQRLTDAEVYRSLLDHSGDAIFLVAIPSGRIERVNHAACRLLGRSMEELCRTTFEEVSSPEGKTNILGLLDSMQAEGPRVHRIAMVLQRQDGERIPVEIAMNKLPDSKGFVVTVHDVSDRKEAEEELGDARARHMNILDAIPDMLYEISPDGTILYMNRRASDVLGVPRDKIGRTRLSEFMAHEEAERLQQDILEMVKNRDLSQSISYGLNTPGGQKIPVEVLSTVLEKRDGTLTILGVARDVTDRKHLEERVLRSQRMEAVGRLAGGIAHEFNNLMTAIAGHAELILLSLKPGDPLRSRVEEIRSVSDTANSLTRQLLAFDRKQVLRPSIVNLNSIVSDMEKMLRRLIGEDIELATDLDPAIGFVKADKPQIEQAILNLVINSRDAMPQGGRLLIESRRVRLDEGYAEFHAPVKPGDYVMLSVSDTGVGMEADVQSHIFEPFFTTKEKDRRAGLGLSTVYGIIRQSDGYIWVYSEPYLGTTIKVYLPSVFEDGLAVEIPQEAQAQMRAGTETILLVEDEDSLREMACEVLKRKGYKVLEARNAGEALLISEQHTGLIHLMVTDVVMPRMGGAELSERLQPWHPEMKVLFMSGYTDSAVVGKGLHQTADVAFLEKPFSPSKLTQKVRQVLDESSNRQPQPPKER